MFVSSARSLPSLSHFTVHSPAGGISTLDILHIAICIPSTLAAVSLVQLISPSAYWLDIFADHLPLNGIYDFKCIGISYVPSPAVRPRLLQGAVQYHRSRRRCVVLGCEWCTQSRVCFFQSCITTKQPFIIFKTYIKVGHMYQGKAEAPSFKMLYCIHSLLPQTDCGYIW